MIELLFYGFYHTFAWFQVGETSKTFTANDTNAVSTVSNPYSLGSFEITVNMGAVGNINPTGSDGTVWYYLADGTTKLQDASPSNTYAEVTFSITITYTDGTTAITDSQIKSAWSSLNVDEVDVAFTSTGSVKLSLTSGSAATTATANAGAEYDTFDTSNPTFDSKTWTSGNQTLYVAIAANESATETAGSRGNIVATPKIGD